jgi:4-amino-4-deoxy-L-arabinose transferase-like glycosyltransferase
VIRRLAARVRATPLAGRLVALLALIHALAWALIVPPFHVPDENGHFFYAEYLAETGELPRTTVEGYWFSEEINAIVAASGWIAVIGRPQNRPAWDAGFERERDRIEAARLGREGLGDAATATSNPPLYYLAQAPVALATRSTGVLDRLAAMRLLSVLLAGVTALAAFGFVREVLPNPPWAATVGGAAVALQPLFAFISGGVNNDAMLYAAAAVLFWLLARAFRRGLTVPGAVAIGAVLALGTLAKTQMVGFAPGVALAVLVLARRRLAAAGRSAAAKLVLAAGAAAAVPLGLYFLAGRTLWQRPLVDRLGEATTALGGDSSLNEALSFTWQLYGPRLPFMVDQFPGRFMPEHFWLTGLVGRFGWLDYGLTAAAYDIARVVALIVIAAALAALLGARRRVWARRAEGAVYLLMAAGLLGGVALLSYRHRESSGTTFEQPRYILPLLALYALTVGLAVRAFGRRLGPPVGAGLVMLAVAHAVVSQLATLARYYG